MKILLILLLSAFTFTVNAQFNGIAVKGAPYNQNEHFLFTSFDDTIINGTWTQLANYPQSLFGVNAYYWPSSGKVFTCGGVTLQGAIKKSCYFYNPVTNAYENADSLPAGRWSGKLVRVKDSLYLVGSVNDFGSPDGKLYKYSPNQNHWVERDSMPSPRVHESAVCVYRDSLIICIGGSTNSFAAPTNIIRTYNPRTDRWTRPSVFPINTTTGHAECSADDSTIVVVGGNGPAYINTIYRGRIDSFAQATDSINITWTAEAINDSTLFHTGVYRVGGARAGDWMLFGPASRDFSIYNTIYNVGFVTGQPMFWRRLVPNVPDSAGNRPTIAVNSDVDSVRLYLFAGSVGNSVVLQSAYKFTYGQPAPIGIKQITGNIPEEFKLYQNFPNPFNPSTKIRFEIPSVGAQYIEHVHLIIYDILGREITTLVNEELKPGNYEIVWNAGNLSSGIYLYRLIAGNFSAVKKMILIK